MKKTLSLLALSFIATAAHANTHAEYGRNLAAACASCHGTNGRSVTGMEALAGYPADRMAKAMRDFRSGAKPSTLMQRLAKGYTDEQIDAIAKFYAAQPK